MPSCNLKTPHATLLSRMKKGEQGTVAGLNIAASAEYEAIRVRLLELGFAAGERVQIVAQSFFGGTPLAVRLGNSTFALRRHEAELVEIIPTR